MSDSTSQLAVTNQNPTELAQTGGLGLDFGSKLFALKPATVTIVQPSSTAEGAVKGKLRVNETGDQFDSMFVTLLVMPVEKRQQYLRIIGQDLNRSAENLMCFCNNVTRNANGTETSGPDQKARVPGALRCNGCPKSSWDKWRQTKSKSDMPECDLYYYALMIDTEYKMPLQMYIRSSAKTPFEQGMQNLSRKFAMMKAKGMNPNIFDIGFKLSTKRVESGKFVSWIPQLSDFRVLTPEEREEFGAIYQQFVARRERVPDDGDLEQTVATDQAINAEVSGNAAAEAEYVGTPGDNGTITI